MPEENIRIEVIKAKDLHAFASGIIKKANAGQFIPITLHRALAMSKNPFAAPDDVSLLVAYHREELIGYFGIMAVRLQHGGDFHKAQWFSTWMVSPKFLGRGVGSKLMQAALDLRQDYFIVGSKPARRVCDKFGFKRLEPYRFTVIDFRLAGRFNPISLTMRGVRKIINLIGVKLDIRKSDQFGARVFGKLFDPVIRPILLNLASKRAGSGYLVFQSKQVDRLRSPNVNEPLDPMRTSLQRGDEVSNWMLAFPWVMPTGQSKSEGLDYYFSDTRSEFELFAYEIFSNGYRGYIVFQFSVTGERRVLKVLDADLSAENDKGFVLPMTLEIAKKKRADKIEISSGYAKVLVGGMLGKLILTEKQRIYQVHPKSEDSPLGRAWRDLELNYVDGDMPFT